MISRQNTIAILRPLVSHVRGRVLIKILAGCIFAASFVSGQAMAAGECPVGFTVAGQNVDKRWHRVTDTEWQGMLPIQWVDNDLHFYKRIKVRGAVAKIKTPAALELAIGNSIGDVPSPRDDAPNRRAILLQKQNKRGRHFAVIYNYDGLPQSKCELVTVTYMKAP